MWLYHKEIKLPKVDKEIDIHKICFSTILFTANKMATLELSFYSRWICLIQSFWIYQTYFSGLKMTNKMLTGNKFCLMSHQRNDMCIWIVKTFCTQKTFRLREKSFSKTKLRLPSYKICQIKMYFCMFLTIPTVFRQSTI